MKKINLPDVKDNFMWDIWMSIYHLSALAVADELALFVNLSNKSRSLTELAQTLQLNSRSIEIIVKPLVCFGLLYQSNNTFHLTPTSKTYLLPESPFYWGAILEAQRNREEYKKIIGAIRAGSNQLLFDGKAITDMWKEGSITPEAASNFTKKMHATIFAPSIGAIKCGLFKSIKRLLDVGGGSGCFSIAFIQEYPECAATVFELPAVCSETKKYIAEVDLLDKIVIHPGNFFNLEHWPIGFDGVLLSQILHDWPIEHCKEILKNAYNSMPVGAKIYIHEMLLNDDKISPLTTACFDLLMFVNHKSQQFTKNELFDLLKTIGFKDPQMEKTFGYYSIITAIK
ncbi:methyltransferase [Legionella sp. CNM-4043-24]|uniref:methyltransferase n=1 Tax=Legionella sp. CNM-4043-24 TaxID=3421646 RepID=UPI00403AB0F0